MLGGIIGDIVGSIYEFHNIEIKDFPLFSKNCGFTDDSIRVDFNISISLTKYYIEHHHQDEADGKTDGAQI